MFDLNDVFYFAQIVNRRSFTATSQSLRIPKSTLSHRVSRLEGDLGVRLINRTPRGFSMTEVGHEFYRYAVGVIENAEAAEDAIRQRVSEPVGTIRFTAPVATAQFAIGQSLPVFLSRYPKIKVIAYATNAHVDIISENYDLAIRAHTGCLPDSTLIQRALAPAPWCLFASPTYLDALGSPRRPTELGAFDTLSILRRGGVPPWVFKHASGERVTIRVEPRLVTDDMLVLKQAACQGLGIVSLPGYTCNAEIRSGALRRVLPEWLSGDSTLTALIPVRQGVLPSVRAFIDFISEEVPKAVAI